MHTVLVESGTVNASGTPSFHLHPRVVQKGLGSDVETRATVIGMRARANCLVGCEGLTSAPQLGRSQVR